MSLPPGLLIIVTNGYYSYKRNIGVFDNLIDLETTLVKMIQHEGDCLKKPLKIIQYAMVDIGEYYNNHPNGDDYIVKFTKFPTTEILNNLEKPLRLFIEQTVDPEDETKTREEEYDFEWYVLNDKYDEYSYAPGGQKYAEAEKKINNLKIE